MHFIKFNKLWQELGGGGWWEYIMSQIYDSNNLCFVRVLIVKIRILLIEEKNMSTPLSHHNLPPLPLKSGYLGALTYISSLVALTANYSLAVGSSEEWTHRLPFNQLSQNKHE